MIQSTTAPIQVLLVWYIQILPQCQFYWYDTVHYCPIFLLILHSLTYMTQSTIAQVPVLLIQHSPLLSQYYSYWYDKVYHCPLSATDTTAHVCPRMSPADMIRSTTAPVPDILDTIVHYCPTPALRIPYNALLLRTSPTFVRVPVLLIWYAAHFCPSTSPADMIQSITAPAPDQLIR